MECCMRPTVFSFWVGSGWGGAPQPLVCSSRAVGPLVSWHYPQLMQWTMMVCWKLGSFQETSSAAHSLPNATKGFSFKEKGGKKVLFCFAEEINLQVNIKPTVGNVWKVQSRVTIFLKYPWLFSALLCIIGSARRVWVRGNSVQTDFYTHTHNLIKA